MRLLTLEIDKCINCPKCTIDNELVNALCKESKMKKICSVPRLTNIGIPDWCPLEHKYIKGVQ